MKPIRVLILEDNTDDAELCLHYLKKDGHQLTAAVVAEFKEFQERVTEEPWDIIIADYNLGQLTALDAIGFCRQRQVEIPFIVLTGVGSEELAVESMRLGAADYLTKNSIKFIGLRVEHALKDWRAKQEIKKLNQQIQDLARFPENDPNLVMRIEASGKVSYLNPPARDLLKKLKIREDKILSILPLDFNREIRALIGSNKVIRGKGKKIAGTHLRFTFSSFAELEAILVIAEDITEYKRAEEELQKSEARYRAVFDTNQDVMIVTDSQRRILDINEKALQKIFGFTKEEALGKTTEFLFPDRKGFEEFGETFYHQGRAGLIGTMLKRKTGETFPAETSVTQIEDDLENAPHFLEVHRDISDTVKLREVFREKKAIEMILAGSPLAMFILDASHTITHWNRACEEMTGMSTRQMVGTRRQWMAFYDHERPVAADYIVDGKYDEMLKAYRQKGMKPSGRIKGAWEMERYYKDLGGKDRFILFTVSPVQDEHGRTIAAIEIMQDISERKRAAEEIKLLSRRLISVAEEERKGLAFDLHDELGQSLTALHFGMEALNQSLPEELRSQRKKCVALIELIEQISDTTRNIISELRPAMLDHLGLLPTLEWYISDLASRGKGPRIDFQAVGLKQRLNPDVEIVLYRILQESLHNIAKHGKATCVEVLLTYSHPKVILTVRDDGVGFQQKDGLLPSNPRRQGIGLLGMRERIASVGGKLEVRSKPGKGTVIRAELPVTGYQNHA
jgi:PAS domain S-box-containing protein